MECARRAFGDIVVEESDEDEDDAALRSQLLARKTSKEIANEAEISHEQAVKERERQEAYLREHDTLAAAHLAQYAKDQEESAQIQAEEKRLQVAKRRVAIESEEARQCEKGMEALMDQKKALLERLEERKKADHERATREQGCQLVYQQKRATLKEIKEQLFRDTAEVEQIKAEDEKLMAVKAQSTAGSEEARQCDIGFQALHGQRELLWNHLHAQATMQHEQIQCNRGKNNP